MRADELRQQAGSLAGVLDWVDERFGPVQSLGGSRLDPPDPDWWIYSCRLTRTPPGSLYLGTSANAGGTSTSREEALRRTLGEAVERYSGLTSHLHAELTRASLEGAGVLSRLPTCAPDEPCLPTFRALDVALPLTHARVRSLADWSERLLPAAYVHLGFTPLSGEPHVTMPISTGLAFHSDLSAALWSGLCEVAERDAMMLMWWTRRAAPEIVCDGARLPWALSERLERLRRVGLRARFFDITTDFRVPTVFCVLRGERYPRLVAGAACRADPAAACAKALDETVAVRLLLRRREDRELPGVNAFEWVRQLEDHARLYADARMEPAFDFLLRSGAFVPYEAFAAGPWWAEPASLDALRARAAALADLGLTVLWADVTAPEAEGLGRVVKVIVPEMVPLSQDHHARWLATPRLLRVAGLSEPVAAALNPHPHPFA